MNIHSPSAILMGSKPGSVVALDMLLRRGWSVPAVVVCRDIKHPWLQGPDLETFARSRGIPVLLQSEAETLMPVDFVLSYMYRFRVRSKLRNLARRAALNFHAGPLPEFGGWSFYSMAILENREEYGCTCHYMVDDFDAGDLLKVRRFPMDPGLETAQSLEKKAQKEMLRLFSEFCELAESGDLLPREPQDPQRMRYLDHETFESLKQIPAGADAATVDRIARAFWAPPYPGAWVEWDGQRVEVVPARGREAAGDAFGQDALSNLYGAVGLEKP